MAKLQKSAFAWEKKRFRQAGVVDRIQRQNQKENDKNTSAETGRDQCLCCVYALRLFCNQRGNNMVPINKYG
jgi:hypothetical protein